MKTANLLILVFLISAIFLVGTISVSADSLSESLEELEKSLRINEKVNKCAKLCAGEHADIPAVLAECRSSCYQAYYYGGEKVLDDLIKEFGGKVEEPKENESGCFIATAVYGTPLAEEIDVLREWRDNSLMTNPIGELFVKAYYKLSPPIADFIRDKEILKKVIRIGLDPFVGFLK